MSQVLYVVLCVYLLLPGLRCDNLLCYYSPVLMWNKTFELVLSECPPREQCFKAHARYGNHSALTARGCMLEKDCGQVHDLPVKGTVYTMSYRCCGSNYCNAGSRVALNSVPLLLTMVASKAMLL